MPIYHTDMDYQPATAYLGCVTRTKPNKSAVNMET